MIQTENVDERAPLLPSADEVAHVGGIQEPGTKPIPAVTERGTPGTPDSEETENVTRVSPALVVAVLTIGKRPSKWARQISLLGS